MRAFSGWRVALRMARRDARRSRGRSILVLVMIALPVLAVTAADVVIATQDVSGVESVDRRIGAADASVSFSPGAGDVVQAFDPDDGSLWRSHRKGPLPTVADVRGALGRDVRAVQVAEGTVLVSTEKGRADATAVEVDLDDPLAAGLFDLTEGRWPRSADEVVVNADLAARGSGLGDDAEVGDGAVRRVVGVAESTTYRTYPLIAGPVGSLGVAERATDQTWLLDAGPVTWDDVLALNDLGGTVVSRAVISDPPPDSALDPEIASWSGTDDEWLAVVALIVVMALLEVVLLAGPAFAVTARRQSRNLALVAAAGGTPRQGRRVILAHGLVLGSLAAVLGAGLGIVVGRVAVPVVQRYESSWFGPFDVPWVHLLGIVAFGVLSALLAAVVPAWIASRQDVVAVLGGRRGDRKASLRSPVLGVLLLAAGVAGAAYGAKRPSAGEVAIAASAVVAVLGMILLVPVVVVALARMSRRLPLVLRYAVRDAARHRTRTVPAVAAVAATVAGVVALGISVSSDELENRATYTPQLPMGAGVVNFGWQSEVTASEADAVRAAATEVAPGIRATVVDGIRADRPDGSYTYLSFAAVGGPDNLLMAYGGTLGSDVLVADRVPASDLLGVDAGAVSRADRALAAGGVVALADARLADEVAGLDRVRTSVEEMDPEGNQTGTRRRTFAGAVVAATGGMSVGPQAIVSTEAARRLGLEAQPVGVLLDGATISRARQRDLDEAATAIQQDASVYVERGYRTDGETLVVQLVLGALGAVLMLGGTLTATFLALSDARPDLATLAAVGASPRKRRGVAASYALFVGLVGAVLGAAVGFVPGIAVTYPLTGRGWHPDGAGPSHYLDVPWLLIGTVVVALPLLTAAIVWATARSRLPMVARLD